MLKKSIKVSIKTKNIQRIIEMQQLKFQCYISDSVSQTYDVYDVVCINMIDGTIKATKEGREFNFLLANVVDISVKDETPCFMFEETIEEANND